jgi:integrase
VAHKRLLLAMLYELGLRITDLLRVDWRAINLSTGRVVVRIAKTDETASLELSHVVVAMPANLPRKDGRLFPWSNRFGRLEVANNGYAFQSCDVTQPGRKRLWGAS